MCDTMDFSAVSELTPYPEVNALLVNLTESVGGILRQNLIGLYLSGSLTYDDFVPGRSDIDLQAVVRAPISEELLTAIERMHRGLNTRFPAWRNRLECSYVPIELLQETVPPKTPRPW